MSDEIIDISVKGLKTTRVVRIEGAVYEVSQLGAGTRLDISTHTRELIAASREAMNLKGKQASLSKASKEEQDKALDEIDACLKATNEADVKIRACYERLFVAKDDKADPAALVRSYGANGMPALLERIFETEQAEG